MWACVHKGCVRMSLHSCAILSPLACCGTCLFQCSSCVEIGVQACRCKVVLILPVLSCSACASSLALATSKPLSLPCARHLRCNMRVLHCAHFFHPSSDCLIGVAMHGCPMSLASHVLAQSRARCHPVLQARWSAIVARVVRISLWVQPQPTQAHTQHAILPCAKIHSWIG